MESQNNLNPVGAIDPEIIQRLNEYLLERQKYKEGQPFPLDPPKEYLPTFLAWANSHKELFNEKDQDNIQYASSNVKLYPSRTYAFTSDDIQAVRRWLERYELWLKSERKHILFSMKITDMNGYQFETYLKQIGLIKSE